MANVTTSYAQPWLNQGSTMKKSGLDLKIDLCRFRRKSKKLGAFSSFQFAVFMTRFFKDFFTVVRCFHRNSRRSRWKKEGERRTHVVTTWCYSDKHITHWSSCMQTYWISCGFVKAYHTLTTVDQRILSTCATSCFLEAFVQVLDWHKLVAPKLHKHWLLWILHYWLLLRIQLQMWIYPTKPVNHLLILATMWIHSWTHRKRHSPVRSKMQIFPWANLIIFFHPFIENLYKLHVLLETERTKYQCRSRCQFQWINPIVCNWLEKSFLKWAKYSTPPWETFSLGATLTLWLRISFLSGRDITIISIPITMAIAMAWWDNAEAFHLHQTRATVMIRMLYLRQPRFPSHHENSTRRNSQCQLRRIMLPRKHSN